MLQGLLGISGVCLASWVGFGFFYVKKSSINWRFPVDFQAVFAIILTAVLLLPGRKYPK